MRQVTERRRRRVLLVTDAYPPLIGGADRAVQLLGYELRDRGFTVQVATAWQSHLPADEDDRSIPVHRLRDLSSRLRATPTGQSKHSPPPFPDPEAVWRLHRLLRHFKPDIVHSYGWLTYSCVAALLGKDIALVVSMRDYGNVCAVRTLMEHDERVCSGPTVAKCLSCAADFYGPAKGCVAVASVIGGRRPLVRRLAGVHYNSTYMQQVMRRDLLRSRSGFETGIPQASVPTFRDDSLDAAPDPEILGRLPDQPFILFVGALRRVKGVEVLLQAYRELGDSPPPLVLIGTREIDNLPEIPSGVLIFESVPHGTVMAAWSRALFGVFPSIWPEPFGNVVHEAMSRGRPVIGTHPGGHGDMIVHERNGLLVAGGSRVELVAAMQRLIADRGLRERLGRAAARSGGDFTAELAMPKLLALYEQAIATQSRRSRFGPIKRQMSGSTIKGDRHL